MTTFDTPQPIAVTIDVFVGSARFVASDRRDTLVDIRPTNPSKSADVKAAEGTRVELADGKLQVLAPKSWKQYTFFSMAGSIDVTIELPTGSSVHGDSSMGDFSSEGQLGNIKLDRTGALEAHTAYGDIRVESVDGNAEITTSSGDLDIRKVAGTAQVKNSNGASKIGNIVGDLRIRSSNGDITVDSADASIDAKTANGSILAANVARGSIALATACGDLEIGIREGSAAWLDVSSSYGDVRNSMASTVAPPSSGDTVEVHGRTSYGDIVIRRSAASV